MVEITDDVVKSPTATEMLRVAHALLPAVCPVAGEAYVVASRLAPLHRVLGVVRSLSEARELKADPARWAVRLDDMEREKIGIFGPFTVADGDAMLIILPRPHIIPSEWQGNSPPNRPPGRPPGKPGDGPRAHEVTRVHMRVEYVRNGQPDEVSYEMQGPVDAIFLTRGAEELFFLPAYERFFGTEYVAAMRKRLG